MGQNFAGVARLKIKGEPGQKITLRFAERLNPDGTIYTVNLRGARATDTYICRGHGTETWEPRFTFHGFQYVEVTGLKKRPSKDTITGLALSSATTDAGRFELFGPDAQPAGPKYLLDATGQLHRHPDRLPAAGRAPGLDGRRAGLYPGGDVA